MTGRSIGGGALALSSDAEKAAVLDELVASGDALAERAEGLARLRLEDVDGDAVASGLADAVLALDQDELSRYAGPTRYGYVEPTEAAWQLLEQALEPWLQDITRRADLGLVDAARRLGLGMLEGLQRVTEHAQDDELLVAWAPDFPAEAAALVSGTLAEAGIDVSVRPAT